MLAKIINNEVTEHNFPVGTQVVLMEVYGQLEDDKLWLCLGQAPDDAEAMVAQVVADSELKLIGGRNND